MNEYGDCYSVTFRTTVDSPQLFVDRRCRLRQVIPRTAVGRTEGTAGYLQLMNGLRPTATCTSDGTTTVTASTSLSDIRVGMIVSGGSILQTMPSAIGTYVVSIDRDAGEFVTGWAVPTGTATLTFSTPLYEISQYTFNPGDTPGTIYAESEVVDLGQHGILFPDGIWAQYFDSTGGSGVWCDAVTLIYS